MRFGEPRLQMIETAAAAETRLPVAVIATARRKLAVIRAAPDFDTLRNWKSFGLSAGAKFPGEHSVWVASDWEMMISFKQEGQPVSVVLSVHEAAQGRAAQ